MKTESINQHLKEKLKDPYFKELHELEEQKLGIVKRIVEYRIRHGLNHKQLASRVKDGGNGQFDQLTFWIDCV